MNRKTIGILIIIIGLILLVGIVYFIFFYNPSPQESVGEDVVTDRANNLPAVAPTITLPNNREVVKNTTQPAVVYSPKEKNESDLKRSAVSFAERFGSFSNQANYGNIEDLKMFMSSKMRKWADNFMKEARENSSGSNAYYGVITKAISQKVKSFDDSSGRSEILVQTIKVEIRENGNKNSFHQALLLEYVKEKGVWKVDSAIWQEKK